MILETKSVEDKINEIVASLDFKRDPYSLFEPIEYILFLGGKRLRPVLALIGANLFADDVTPAINPALAIEVFHNFSLLHDDLMDRADMRRGKPTVHKVWDDNTAILSGDAMLIEAYKHIANVDASHLKPMLDLFSTTAMDVCRGQQYDMDFESRLDVEGSEYLEMIRLKTAVLIACALKLGALSVDAPEEDAEALYNYGIHIGLAFQLRDDILDVYGNPAIFGKKIGGDILCNKKTYLLILALKQANEQQLAELHRWIEATDFDPAEKIAAVSKIYDELNLKHQVEVLIEKYYASAMDYMSAIEVTDARKAELLSLGDAMMYREK